MSAIDANANYTISDDDEIYYIILEAENGSSHNSSYLDVDENLVILNNLKPKGKLGSGKKLKEIKKIIVNSNLDNNSPTLQTAGKDKITLNYTISSSIEDKPIYTYDEPLESSNKPSVYLNIEFK